MEGLATLKPSVGCTRGRQRNLDTERRDALPMQCSLDPLRRRQLGGNGPARGLKTGCPQDAMGGHNREACGGGTDSITGRRAGQSQAVRALLCPRSPPAPIPKQSRVAHVARAVLCPRSPLAPVLKQVRVSQVARAVSCQGRGIPPPASSRSIPPASVSKKDRLLQMGIESSLRGCTPGSPLGLGSSSPLGLGSSSPLGLGSGSPLGLGLGAGYVSGRQRLFRVVVRAGDFDGGDDDIIEFDAEDADLDDDVEIEEFATEEEKRMEASLMDTSATVVETSIISDVVLMNEMQKDGLLVQGEAVPEGFTLNEDEFHCVSLYACDFFIKRCPDVDDDVYDFSEIYVAPPASQALSTPTIYGALPTQARRCTASEWTYVTGKTMPYSTDPYHASAKEIREVTKVFLTRHLGDERASSPHFVLDFEEIYVLDGQEKSIRRANVALDLPDMESPRDRKNEVLIVRDDGTSFKIVPREAQRHVDEVIAESHWHQTKDSVENYLRGFRDFDKSNWF